MPLQTSLRIAAGTALLSVALFTGCKTADQQALDQAKAQAAATNTAQQIQYIDKNGDTVTTIVQPPVTGQPQQITTNTVSPPPGPPPHRTRPVVTSLGPAATSSLPTVAATPSTPSNLSTPSETQQPAAVAGNQTATAAPVSFTVPAGTELAIRINQHISVKTSRAGDHFTGEVVEPIESGGTLLIPRGTPVRGRIDASHRRGHFKGRSILELRLTSLTLNGTEREVVTRDSVRTKKGKGKRSSAFIGGLTGAGMIIGGVATGGVGLAIGGAAGAGAGTLLAGATGNRDINIPAESIIHFRLADPLTL